MNGLPMTAIWIASETLRPCLRAEGVCYRRMRLKSWASSRVRAIRRDAQSMRPEARKLSGRSPNRK